MMGSSNEKKQLRLQKKQTEWLFYLSLAVVGIYVFLLAGGTDYILFDDSHTYIEKWYTEGVMPLYPLFIRLNLFMFGEELFLTAVVAEQAVLATVCTMVLTAVIKKQFSLRCSEAYVIYAFSLIPFTIELPTAMITHMVLTEGLAYALFYLFAVILLKAVWERSGRWLAAGWFMALFLSLIRSQLLLLFAVWLVMLLYVTARGKSTGARKAGILALALAGGMALGLLGGIMNLRINSAYQNLVQRAAAKADREAEEEKKSDEEQAAEQEEKAEDTPDGKSRELNAVSVSQYASLFFSRGMYEADYEDYLLFEEEETQQLFLYLYEAADAEKCRYEYAGGGLWIWKDIVGGIGKVGKIGFTKQNEFYHETRPEVFEEDYNGLSNRNYIVIGTTLLKAHFGRFLCHSLLLLPQGFICTVFFQIAPLYLLCHLITLFLYVSAAGLMIWAYADAKVRRDGAELMVFVLGTNLVMVLLISLVFFGQQRYLFYTFGLFYMAYFLLLLEWWKQYGRKWLEKKRQSRRRRPEDEEGNEVRDE